MILNEGLQKSENLVIQLHLSSCTNKLKGQWGWGREELLVDINDAKNFLRMERLNGFYFSQEHHGIFDNSFPPDCYLLRICYRWVMLILLIFANNLSTEGLREPPER